MGTDDMGFDRLDACAKWNMPPDHVLAYQICLMWIEYSKQVFPNYRHYKMPVKGDPRKGMLFKYCLKLVNETKGLVTDYPLYIKAQLQVLKCITDGVEHPLIDPRCLCGPQAWKRWKLWKRKYDQLHQTVRQEEVKTPVTKIKMALENTKIFFVQQWHGEPTLEKLREAITNRNLYRWIAGNKVSPYYLKMSAHIKSLFPDVHVLESEARVDLDLYQFNPEELRPVFQQLFPGDTPV
jgi:hypothetical protein